MRRIACLTGLLALLALPSAAAAATVDLFGFPAGHAIANFGVAVDGTGDVWLSASGPVRGSQPTPSVVRADPATLAAGTSQGTAAFPTPDPGAPLSCCANQLRSVTYNPVDGFVYYVRSDRGLGRFRPDQVVPGTSTGMTAGEVPGPVVIDLWDVAPAKTGGVFLTEKTTGNSPDYQGARLASWAGGLSEGPNVARQNGVFVSARYDARPSGVAVAPDGTPWFVEEDAGLPGYRVASWTPGSAFYTEYKACQPTPGCNGPGGPVGLTDVTVAPDGDVWFVDTITKELVRLHPATQVMTRYAVAAMDPTLAPGTPRQITTAPDGSLWMTVTHSAIANGTANALVRIDPSDTPTATVHKLGLTTSPLGVAADAAGNVWFGVSTQTAGVAFGRLAGASTPLPGGGGDGGGGGAGGGGAPAGPGPGAGAPAALPNPRPVVLTPASVGRATLSPPATRGDEIDTNQICVGPPESRCSVVYMVREREYVTAYPSAAGGKKKARKKAPRVLGTKTVTLRGGQRAKVTLRLNRLGRRILKGQRRLRVVFTASEKLANGKTRTVSRKNLTMRP